MPHPRFTDSLVRAIQPPARGQKIVFDGTVPGFGVRVMASGARSYVMQYRTTDGRQRRYTIGSTAVWRAIQAREEAAALRRAIDVGRDPASEAEAERGAPTMTDLCARYEAEWLPQKRARSADTDKAQIKTYLLGEGIKKVEGLPKFKHRKVVDISYADVSELHRVVSRERGPIAANRVVALLSKMMSLAVRWGWRTDNPARGVQRNQEERRERYLSADEMARLVAALPKIDATAAAIVKLLLLTGARKGEVFTMRWQDIDLDAGVWVKPSALTKQRKVHRATLNDEAVAILRELHAVRGGSVYVFPSRTTRGPEGLLEDAPIKDIKKSWAVLLKAANIREFRMHDLRHSFASVLVSSGVSLPQVGALLGHTQASTTLRYSHLSDDALRTAAGIVGKAVTRAEGQGKGEAPAQAEEAEPAA